MNHAPTHVIRSAKTYREAVRLSWSNRQSKNMTLRSLAELTGSYASHISDYMAEDDRPGRRDLPANKIHAFSLAVGNTIIVQWLAAQSSLVIFEQQRADDFCYGLAG